MSESKQVEEENQKANQQRFEHELNSKADETRTMRSEEVQEILTRIPSWTIRWGITVVFFLILLAGIISNIIKYPEIIEGKAILSTRVPAPKLSSNSSGEIQKNYFKNGDLVNEGEVISSLKNPLTQFGLNSILQLTQAIDSLLYDATYSLPDMDSNAIYGQVQATIIELREVCNQYQYHMLYSAFQNEQNSLSQRIAEYEELIEINQAQIELSRRELENGRRNFEADKVLYKEGAIAEMTYLKEESELNGKESSYHQAKQALVEKRIVLIEMNKQLRSQRLAYRQKKLELRNQIKLKNSNLKNEMAHWEQRFVIRANRTGRLVWLKQYAPNQFTQSGDELFAIIPRGESVEGLVFLNSTGLGKVKTGQKVRFSLDNFPYQEYGFLVGTVESITPIANKNDYRIHVQLEQELVSNYGYAFEYLPEMKAWAEIITEDLTLFQRIMHNVRKVFKRSRKNAKGADKIH